MSMEIQAFGHPQLRCFNPIAGTQHHPRCDSRIQQQVAALREHIAGELEVYSAPLHTRIHRQRYSTVSTADPCVAAADAVDIATRDQCIKIDIAERAELLIAKAADREHKGVSQRLQ